jgi:hypothetical protein
MLKSIDEQNFQQQSQCSRSIGGTTPAPDVDSATQTFEGTSDKGTVRRGLFPNDNPGKQLGFDSGRRAGPNLGLISASVIPV